MNKKIFFLILVLLSIITNVKALENVLEIDDTNYVLTKDINTSHYSYTVSNNTLVLNNYKGSHIKKEGTLNVIVNGDNYLSDKNGLVLIKANDLIISGDGTLNFDSNAAAITADNVSINNIKINGTTTRELIYSTNEIAINDAKINFEAKGILIFGGNSININNSIIKSNNRWGFRYTTNGLATINNSDINMECSATCISATAKMHFNSTNAYFYGKTSASSNNMELSFEKTGFTISDDGVNYRESIDYNGYPYLKTMVVINSNGDNHLNQDNDLIEDKDEDENNSPISSEDNGEENSNSLNSNEKDSFDDDNIANKDTDDNNFNNKDNDNLKEDDNKVIDKEDLNDNINDKMNDINNNLNNDILEENDNENSDNIYTKNEYENNDFYTKSNYDNILVNQVENPKTYDGVGISIFWLILSLMGIIIPVIILKRNTYGKA